MAILIYIMEFSYHILNLKHQQFGSSNSIISLKTGRSDKFLTIAVTLKASLGQEHTKNQLNFISKQRQS